MDDRRRVHVLVSGRVQGVFYRATCIDRARALRLGGWIRNLADGRVEAVFEGTRDDVATILAWCGSGPPHARVDAVDVEEEPATGETVFRVVG